MDPNNFSFIEYFLSKFKTLRILLEGCKIKKDDGSLIYCILAKLGPAYSVFVSAFHSTREAIISSGTTYKNPSFDAFCDSLIREQEKILHLGLITAGNASKKALAAQQQSYQKNPKKQYLKKYGSKPNKNPSFDSFCDSLIREQEKLLHLGLITSENACLLYTSPSPRD